jgi:hypothetical protein
MGSQPAIVPVRLALLEADTPVPGIKAKYQSYGGVFTHLFKRACASFAHPVSLESQLSLSSHDIVNDLNAYPDPESIDAILITGSKFNAFDNDEWILRLVQFTKRCLEDGRVRVIGVCFGHQIIGRALGAELGRNTRGWEISVVEHELTEEGRKVFGLEKLVRMAQSPNFPFRPVVQELFSLGFAAADQSIYDSQSIRCTAMPYLHSHQAWSNSHGPTSAPTRPCTCQGG